MTILDDLATWLSDETAMTVRRAVVLFSGDDDLPRFRLAKEGVAHHVLMDAPAGLFLADVELGANRSFFSALAEGSLSVDEPIRLDPKATIVVENNWPSKKVEIDGRYYAVPRNFAALLDDLLSDRPTKRRR